MYASPNSCGEFALLLATNFQLATGNWQKKSLGNTPIGSFIQTIDTKDKIMVLSAGNESHLH
jgi:hypothetical protein